jgi:hypothetical protein
MNIRVVLMLLIVPFFSFFGLFKRCLLTLWHVFKIYTLLSFLISLVDFPWKLSRSCIPLHWELKQLLLLVGKHRLTLVRCSRSELQCPNWRLMYFSSLNRESSFLISVFPCRTTWVKCLPTIQQWCRIHLAHQLWFSPGLDLCPSYLVITARLAPYLPSQISKILFFCSNVYDINKMKTTMFFCIKVNQQINCHIWQHLFY